MNIIEQLMTASSQLKELFRDKAELKGYNDWDIFLGCVMLIDNAAKQLQQMDREQEEEITAEE